MANKILQKRSQYPWPKNLLNEVSLDAAGLVALADLTTIARRTALTGTATWLDIAIICPGLHRQQSAPELNLGEYPAATALRTGYVFRVENPATVVFLQKMSRTGHLTTMSVSDWRSKTKTWPRFLCTLLTFQTASLASASAYSVAVALTIIAGIMMGVAGDFWGLGVLLVLIAARVVNTKVIRSRCQPGWKGEKEPGVQGDLLVLLSQDRWVRMKGTVDDLKMVTSGHWLREQTFYESSLTALATVLVYLDAALASNVSQSGKVILLALLIASAGLLALANEYTDSLFMHGCIVKLNGPRKSYGRRLNMVEDFLRETDRVEWAMRLGMSRLGMTVDKEVVRKHQVNGSVTM